MGGGLLPVTIGSVVSTLLASLAVVAVAICVLRIALSDPDQPATTRPPTGRGRRRSAGPDPAPQADAAPEADAASEVAAASDVPAASEVTAPEADVPAASEVTAPGADLGTAP
ncbi:MAG TPA: hypothetical protein VHG90_11000, partial [Acidimicrobiales bacterium]|nr:hypothetical protein [Acidimicrobiales bacterium]